MMNSPPPQMRRVNSNSNRRNGNTPTGMDSIRLHGIGGSPLTRGRGHDRHVSLDLDEPRVVNVNVNDQLNVPPVVRRTTSSSPTRPGLPKSPMEKKKEVYEFQTSLTELSDLMLMNKQDAPLQIRHVLLVIFAFIGIILMVIQLTFYDESSWHKHPEHIVPAWYCRVGISVSTLFTLVTLISFYLVVLARERRDMRYIIGVEKVMGSLFTSPKRYHQLGEFILLALHLPPLNWPPEKYDWDYDDPEHWRDTWNLILFLRLYLIFRLLRDYQYLYRYRKVYDGGTHFEEFSTVWFSVKTAFFHHPHLCIAIPSFLFVVVMSFCIWVTERVKDPDFDFGTSVWFVFAAMTTVGYGDVVPKEILSRFLSGVATIIGIVLASMYVAVLSQQFLVTDHQLKAIRWAQRVQHTFNEKVAAAEVLQTLFRYWRARNKKKISIHNPEKDRSGVLENLRRKCFLKLSLFRKLRKDRQLHEFMNFDRLAVIEDTVTDTLLLTHHITTDGELPIEAVHGVLSHDPNNVVQQRRNRMSPTTSIGSPVFSFDKKTQSGRTTPIRGGRTLQDLGMRQRSGLGSRTGSRRSEDDLKGHTLAPSDSSSNAVLVELRSLRLEIKGLNSTVARLERTIEEDLPEALALIASRKDK